MSKERVELIEGIILETAKDTLVAFCEEDEKDAVKKISLAIDKALPNLNGMAAAPDTSRAHDLSDGFVIVGFRPLTKPLSCFRKKKGKR